MAASALFPIISAGADGRRSSHQQPRGGRFSKSDPRHILRLLQVKGGPRLSLFLVVAYRPVND